MLFKQTEYKLTGLYKFWAFSNGESKVLLISYYWVDSSVVSKVVVDTIVDNNLLYQLYTIKSSDKITKLFTMNLIVNQTN